MVFQEAIFWILAVSSVAAALGMVLLRDIFRAALLLVVVFLGVAGAFVLMNAEFLAVVQVLIYAGAIAILIIFAIMLTRDVQSGNLPNRLQAAAVLLPGLLLVALIFVAVDTDWRVLASDDQPIPEEAHLQEQFVKDQALRRIAEVIQTNTVGGLPADWEESLDQRIRAGLSEATGPEAREIAKKGASYLELGRLKVTLGFELLPEFTRRVGDEIKRPSEALRTALGNVEVEEARIVLSKHAAIRDKVEGTSWWLDSGDGDLLYTVIRTDGGLAVYEGRFEDADDRSGIGELLINDFVLPFEAASVLLLAAVIGALVLVRER